MKRCLAILAVISLPGAGLPAEELCSYDDAPAATLLLPYFEVDLEDPDGRTTLFSVATTSPESTLVHLVIWSDLGVPVLDFPIFLTGYDVQTINLRDLLADGAVPVTGPTLTAPGAFSGPRDFPGCDTHLPLPTQLPPVLLEHVQATLTGQPSAVVFEGNCAGFDHGDLVARGFITLDVAERCEPTNPTRPGYFGAGGVAGFDNVLWGDYYLVDAREGLAQGENLVRIHAREDFFEPDDATFYGRFVSHDGSDGREPLPSTWAARFAQGGAFSGGTDLVVWRAGLDSPEPFPCGSPPAPLETSSEFVCAFDEEENPDCFGYCGIIDPPPPYCPGTRAFPLEANRTAVGGPELLASWDFGWIYANFNLRFDGLQRQTWVSTLSSAEGRFSVGLSSTPLDRGCDAPEPPPWFLVDGPGL